ncbi:hypothetical protein B0H19DRAFT_637643 [Mycena capillaripes]|nr:hypothetical protein B0H19DRAFT_637643 [Mycena capillaripes]
MPILSRIMTLCVSALTCSGNLYLTFFQPPCRTDILFTFTQPYLITVNESNACISTPSSVTHLIFRIHAHIHTHLVASAIIPKLLCSNRML